MMRSQENTQGFGILQFNKHLLRSFTPQTSIFKASISDYIVFLRNAKIFYAFRVLNWDTGVCVAIALSVVVSHYWKSKDTFDCKNLCCCFPNESVIHKCGPLD